MRRNSLLPLGILSASAVAVCVAARSQQVYAAGVFASGTTYFQVCTTSLPFAPFKYDLTELAWLETSNGVYICGIPQGESGDVRRRCLEVESGSADFFLPLDSGPPRTPFISIGDPPIAPTIVPTVKGLGDFASAVIQASTNRGGRAITNALPVIQANWISGSRTNEDIFILQGDRFAEVQNLLEQAYGKATEEIPPSKLAGGDCRSINYSPAQAGAFLNLTRALDDNTIVSIIGTQKPHEDNKTVPPGR